jgi:dipeptidyl aminopeptidase/acylaminoacyl peptidase
VTVIKRGRIYSNFALNAAYLPAGGTYGDIAWDPQSKRIYVVSTNGEFGYISQDAERWDPDASGNLAYQRFSQGTVTPGQMCMTWDGRKIIAQTSAGTAVFTINRIPATAIATSLGTVTAGVGCVDASNWPSTLAIPPF